MISATDTFQQFLAARGYRVTPQRVGIYEFLRQSRSHPTAEEIYQALQERFPMMSQATVYKTLELLVQLGLVTELGFGDEPNRYDGNPVPHINIRCLRCGRIDDLEEPSLPALEASVRRRSGFTLVGQRYEYYGICPHCQQKEELRAPGSSQER